MAFFHALVLSLAFASTHAVYNYRFMDTAQTPNNYWEDWCRPTTTTASGTQNVLCCELGDRAANGGDVASFRQSPIDIPAGLTATAPASAFVFSAAYSSSITGTLVNNGHTAQFDIPAAVQDTLTVTGGIFGSCTYKLAQFHCHWGDKTRQTLTGTNPTSLGEGSEHYVQGTSYMSECHLVHLRVTETAECMGDGNAAAVLGFLFEESTVGSSFLNLYNQNAAYISAKDATRTYSVNFQTLLFSQISSLNDYYNYDGSLTTPSCSEIVRWVLFRNPIPATRGNIVKLRRMREGDGTLIRNNWRRPQELGTRTVTWYQL